MASIFSAGTITYGEFNEIDLNDRIRIKYDTEQMYATEFEEWSNEKVTFKDDTHKVFAFELIEDKNLTIEDIFNLFYPVGAIYMSTKSTGKPTFGTWEAIEGKYLYGADSSHAAGSAFNNSVTLTSANMPAHSHTFTPSGTVSTASNSHTHFGSASYYSHNHSISTSSNGGHTHTVSIYVKNQAVGSGSTNLLRSSSTSGVSSTTNIMYTTYSGSHTHSPSFTSTGQHSHTALTVSHGSHTHTFSSSAGSTSGQGSGAAMSFTPPYKAVYTWRRVG